MKATATVEAIEYKAESLAREAMKEADGNVVEATALLEEWARRDVDIWVALTENVLRLSCYNACRSVCREQRKQVWYSPGYDGGGNGARIHQHSAMLMDFPLPGGKPLRDATKGELIEAAGFYRTQSLSMVIRAAWLESIAERVKKKTVGSTLTEEELRQLQSDAKASQGIT